jgi:hypothetical protein
LEAFMTRTSLAVVAALLLVSAPPQRQAEAVPAGYSCGGFVGWVCDRGLWCDPVPGTCGVPLAGVCRRVPEVCTRIYRPVCGCDGKTDANDCERQARRVPKAADGPCRPG